MGMDDCEDADPFLDAKHALINEIERISCLLSVEAKILAERSVALDEIIKDIRALDPQGTPPSRLIKLNIGGQLVDIQRDTLSQAPWNLFSVLLSPTWERYLMRDQQGRIFLDYDFEWVEPILTYFRSLRLVESARLHGPLGVSGQAGQGFEALLDYFDLRGLALRPTPHAERRWGAEAVDDDLLGQLSIHSDRFRDLASGLRAENRARAEAEGRLLKELTFVREHLRRQQAARRRRAPERRSTAEEVAGDSEEDSLTVTVEPRAEAEADDAVSTAATVSQHISAPSAEEEEEEEEEDSDSSGSEGEALSRVADDHLPGGASASGEETETEGGLVPALRTAFARLTATLQHLRAAEGELVNFNIGGQRVTARRSSLIRAYPGSCFASLDGISVSGEEVWSGGDRHGELFMDVPREAFGALVSYARLLALRPLSHGYGHGGHAHGDIKIFVPSAQLDVLFALQDLLGIGDEDLPLESA